MIRRKVVTCDVCGEDITNFANKYKFQKYKWVRRKWSNLDICENCFNQLKSQTSERQTPENNKITNLQMVHQMSLDELVDLMRCPYDVDPNYSAADSEVACIEKDCDECARNWLLSEVSENKTFKD